MKEMEKMGITAPPVPKYWAEFLKKIKEGTVRKEDVEEYLAFTTGGKLVFNTLLSVAHGKLPEKGEDVRALILNLFHHNRKLAENILRMHGVSEAKMRKGLDKLEAEIEQLARIVALIKDKSYIEKLEAELAPLIEKVPETKKVGLFRRESPRKKIEDFVALIMEPNILEEEASRKAEELRDVLLEYMTGEEAEKLVQSLLIPYKAEKLKRVYGSAERFLKGYAFEIAKRLTAVEAHLYELLQGRDVYDKLLKNLSMMPSLESCEKLSPRKFEETKKLLEKFRSL